MKHHFNRKSILLVITMLWTLTSVFGCVSINPQSSAMVPDAFDVAVRHPGSIDIVATGIKQSIPSGTLEVTDDVFRKALEESIIKSRVFSSIALKEKAEYQLSVAIVSLEESPGPPFDFDVDMETGWMLKRADTEEIIWRGSVKSSHTATIQKAVEGAMQENIRQGINEISQLKF